MLTLDKIYHAAFVLKDVARKTDLIEAPKLSKDCQLYLKTENLQATGSFKVRGAYYKISQLSQEESAKGVIACSAGNHAQGVALAATRRGIRSIVCMPDGAPLMKVENTKNLGAEVCLVPGTYDEAHDKAVQLQKEYDMTFIHPYDDEQVIAGQGTIGLEILDQLPDVDAVVVPVGGGGLISGIAFAIKTLRPEVKVYGVQAEGAPSMYRSLHEHKYQTLKAASTFADGIQVKTPGELTYQICEQYVDDIVTVTEDETAAAILSLMENQKLFCKFCTDLLDLRCVAGLKSQFEEAAGNGHVGVRTIVLHRHHIAAAAGNDLCHLLQLAGLVLQCDGQICLAAAHDKTTGDDAVQDIYINVAAGDNAGHLFALHRQLVEQHRRHRHSACTLGHQLLVLHQGEDGWRPATMPRSNRSGRSSPKRASSWWPSACKAEKGGCAIGTALCPCVVAASKGTTKKAQGAPSVLPALFGV